MKLLAIRHLPTALNRDGRLQGLLDTEILAPDPHELAGIAQNCAAFAHISPLTVVTSALRRTQQTALAHGLVDFVVEPLANELDFGPFQGWQRDDFLAAHRQAWLEDPYALEFGESVASLEGRIRRFLGRYGHYEQVLLFGHGAWLRGLRALLEDGHLRRMNQVELPHGGAMQWDCHGF